MAVPDSIQSILQFPRKFHISEDREIINWATVTDVEQLGEITAAQISALQVDLSNINHGSLQGINSNDHHPKSHSDSHNGDGVDSLTLPFEFKDNGTVVFKIDVNGNVFHKGRLLKIT